MADIKVRVGQQNAIKVLSSISGSAGGYATLAENVIGGIASVSSLIVSGVSTFVGVSTFNNNVYIRGDLYINDDTFLDEFTARNANITGITTVLGGFYYGSYYSGGIAYFNNSGLMVSTGGTNFSISYTNYILTTDNTGTPTWSSVIDGGSY
jgi:hypothetical protein